MSQPPTASHQPPAPDQVQTAPVGSNPTPTPTPPQFIIHNSTFIITYALPAALFLVLSVLFTWPLLLHFGDEVVASGSGDVWQHLWNIWWVKRAIVDLHTSPFYTDYLFYPTGVSLRFHALNQLGGLLSIPFQALFGLTPAFDTMVLFNLTIAGFGAYLFARYLLRLIHPEREPAMLACIAAGIAFAYSTGEASYLRLGQLELMSIQWLPYGALFLLKSVTEIKPDNRLKIKDESDVGAGGGPPNSNPPRPSLIQNLQSPLLAALFITLASQHTWYYGLYLGFFAALVGIYALVVRWGEGWAVRLLVVRQLAIAVGGFGLAVSWWALVPMIQELRATPQLAASLNTVVYNSVDLPGLFRPGPSLLWGNIATNASSWNITLVAGLLALVGLAIGWRRGRGLTLFLLLTALFFFILALGPYLKMQAGGLESVTHLGEADGPTVPLPFLLLYNTPIGGIARITSRYSIMGMLFVGLLAAIALDYLLARRGSNRWLYPTLSGLLVVLMMVEAIPAGGQPLQSTASPPFYAHLAATAPAGGSYAVMDVPTDCASCPARFMLYETVHQQKMLGGYTSRHYDYPFALETPAVRQLYGSGQLDSDEDIIDRNLAASGMAVLNSLNIRYLVLHEEAFSGNQRDKLQVVIDQIWPNTQPQRDGNLTVYTVTVPSGNPPPALELGGGWHQLEQSKQQGSYRWSNGDATVIIWTPRAMSATLSTKVYSYLDTRRLDVSLNGAKLTTVAVATTDTPLTLTLSLRAGLNRVYFHAQEGPAKAPGNDPRMIAVGFKKIVMSDKLGLRFEV